MVLLMTLRGAEGNSVIEGVCFAIIVIECIDCVGAFSLKIVYEPSMHDIVVAVHIHLVPSFARVCQDQSG